MSIKIYRVEDIMEMLKVTRRTVYSHIKDGQIKGNKVAGKWVFTEEQIRDYLEGKNKR